MVTKEIKIINSGQFKKGHKQLNTGKSHFKKGFIGYWKGKKRPSFSEATKKKMGERQIGDKNHQWKGGISFNPYPKKFNDRLKLKIRTRDNFTCCLCGKTEREELEELNRVLCVNHIDFNKNNCKEINLNTLCVRCNVRICRQREYYTNYFNQ